MFFLVISYQIIFLLGIRLPFYEHKNIHSHDITFLK